MGIKSSHKAHAQRSRAGTHPGTALHSEIAAVPEGYRLTAFVLSPSGARVTLGEYIATTAAEAEAALLADGSLSVRWRACERGWRQQRDTAKRSRRGAWFKRRGEADPVWRLNRNIRAAICQSLSGHKNRHNWQALAGYTLADLRAHLETQFADGMSWANYGAWHVDHVRPLASFNITDTDCPDFKAAWALSNLQPLWGPENLSKGAKWSHSAVSPQTVAWETTK